jgi:DNA-binding CsgD family transcriptional regulator
MKRRPSYRPNGLRVLWSNEDYSRSIEAINGELYFVRREPIEELVNFIETHSANVTLTKRENEVLNAMVNQLSSKEISTAINLSVRTVKFHKSSIYRKYGVNSQSDLLRKLEKSVYGKALETESQAKLADVSSGKTTG